MTGETIRQLAKVGTHAQDLTPWQKRETGPTASFCSGGWPSAPRAHPDLGRIFRGWAARGRRQKAFGQPSRFLTGELTKPVCGTGPSHWVLSRYPVFNHSLLEERLGYTNSPMNTSVFQSPSCPLSLYFYITSSGPISGQANGCMDGHANCPYAGI